MDEFSFTVNTIIMLSQQLLNYDTLNYSNPSVHKSLEAVKINWSQSKNELRIQSFIILDKIVYSLKNLGLQYDKANIAFAENCNEYAKINTIVQHSRIELENKNYDESIELLNSALAILKDSQELKYTFNPLLQILLTLNYYYKKEANRADFYLNMFNESIAKFIKTGIHVDPEIINKISIILNNEKEIMLKNPFLSICLKGQDLEFVTRIIDLIDNNLDNEKLCVTLLSRELYLSPSQVYRKISALTSYTVVELIRLVKLDRAKKMLEANTTNVSGVANRIAYSASHFTRVFTKQYGISPKEVLVSI